MTRTRFVALLLFAALNLAGFANAQVVTIQGAGTIDMWYTVNTGTGDIPAVLRSAFEPVPDASPFAAGVTYDTRFVSGSVVSSGAQYFDAATSMSLQLSGHTIVPNHASALGNVIYVNDQPTLDSIAVALNGHLIDGSPSFAGYRVARAIVGVSDTDATALSTPDLPGALCLAEWERLFFEVAFAAEEAPNRWYVVQGYDVPDRSIDSDSDGPNDQAELDFGSNPCNADTDGDGLNDPVDPDPLVPRTSTEVLGVIVRDTATGILDIPESSFAGPNANAQRGKRNALANQLQAAANAIEARSLEEALAILEHVLDRLDGDPIPPDAMEDGAAKDALREEVEALIALVRAELAG